MAAEPGWIKSSTDRRGAKIAAGGSWEIEQLTRLNAEINTLIPQLTGTAAAKNGPVRVDLSDMDTLDSGGAWLVIQTCQRLKDSGFDAQVAGAKKAHAALLERVQASRVDRAAATREQHPLIANLTWLGKSTFDVLEQARDLLGFFGLTVIILIRAILNPWRIYLRAVVTHVERTGLNALPIVGLLSFLIGVVLAFQGADQLRRFGAEIFTVNLLGVSVLRELGVLITAIIVAGRSGSAFTAQIGTMKVNQEVDAMETIGLDPIEVLVLPRIVAMLIALPLLVLYADVVGIAGGAVMCLLVLDISFTAFLTQLQDAVTVTTFFVGMSKAPVFAYLIAMVGCFQGLQVTGSAESVGLRTTLSVVQSIFLVIAVDAMFSVFFSFMGI